MFQRPTHSVVEGGRGVHEDREHKTVTRMTNRGKQLINRI
jgi:hypothetical protein